MGKSTHLWLVGKVSEVHCRWYYIERIPTHYTDIFSDSMASSNTFRFTQDDPELQYRYRRLYFRIAPF